MMNEFDYPTCIVVGRESVKGTEAGHHVMWREESENSVFSQEKNIKK
jgi:hypothetical protein